MKEIKEERVISATVYKAFDGTKFDDMRSCEEYDKKFLSTGNRRICPACKGKGTITIPGHYERSYAGHFTEDNVSEYWVDTRECRCHTCDGKGYQQLEWC